MALATTYDECAAEGCDRPYAWCELHHEDPWAAGGATDLAPGRAAVPASTTSACTTLATTHRVRTDRHGRKTVVLRRRTLDAGCCRAGALVAGGRAGRTWGRLWCARCRAAAVGIAVGVGRGAAVGSALGAAAQDAEVAAADLAGDDGRGRCRPAGAGVRGRPASRTASARASRSSVVGCGLRVVGHEADDLPAAGGGEAGRVLGAQVVGVRLGVRRQRAEDGGPVGVDVGQGGDRGPAARRLGAPTGQVHSSDSRWRHRRPGAGTP